MIDKDLKHNVVVVGPEEALGRNELIASHVNWIGGEPPSQPLRLQVKIRYKAPEAWGWVTATSGNRAHVRFDQSLRDITPGQASVFYDNDICLGGGIIEK